jgi:hypothetical protein
MARNELLAAHKGSRLGLLPDLYPTPPEEDREIEDAIALVFLP